MFKILDPLSNKFDVIIFDEEIDKKMFSKVLIVDFGSQYTQLIARRVRELNIFCEIFPFNNLPKKIFSFEAIILSGSPFSVKSNDSPTFNLKNFTENCQFWLYAMDKYIAHNFFWGNC